MGLCRSGSEGSLARACGSSRPWARAWAGRARRLLHVGAQTLSPRHRLAAPDVLSGLIGSGQVQILDTTSLLRSCIQGAVGKLRDQNAGFERSMQRVSILLSLLDTDSTHTGAGGPSCPPPSPGSPPGPESAPTHHGPRSTGRLPAAQWGCVLSTHVCSLLRSCLLSGREDAALRPSEEAGRELPVQRGGVGGEGSLQSGRPAGGRHVQVPAGPGRAVGWVRSLSAEMLLSSQGAPDYLGASCRGFAGRFSTFVC